MLVEAQHPDCEVCKAVLLAKEVKQLMTLFQ